MPDIAEFYLKKNLRRAPVVNLLVHAKNVRHLELNLEFYALELLFLHVKV